MNKKSKFLIFFMGGIYLLGYHYAYSAYINKNFEYAHYAFINREYFAISYSYLLALIPIFFYKGIKNPGNFGVSLLYVMCYMPAQLTLNFMWMNSDCSLMIISTLLAVSMSLIFWVAGFRRANHWLKTKSTNNKNINKFVIILGSICGLSFLLENWSHMRLVGFSDVYELRFDARDAQSGLISGYLNMWLSVFIVPYFSALAVARKNIYAFALSIALAVFVYMGNGAKSVLLLPMMISVLGYLYSKKSDFLINLLLINTIFIVVIFSIESSQLDMLKSVYAVRTLSTAGWTISTYYEYFSSHEWTYFSHIGIINSVFQNYPYGNYSLGQLIGMEYSGSSDANFNAIFWATDGVAALGSMGILISSVPVLIFVHISNRLNLSSNTLLYTLWLTGFWMTLMNASFSVSLLSGAGGLVLFLMILTHRKNNKTNVLKEV